MRQVLMSGAFLRRAAEAVREKTIRVTKVMPQNSGCLIAAAQGMQADIPFENLCEPVDTANEI